MSKTTNDFREKLAKRFIASLQEKNERWEKTWLAKGQMNAVTGKVYTGVNRFVLSLEAGLRQSDDPRWATFNQIKKAGWKLNKGSKGVKIEFWQPYDFNAKLHLTWHEYTQLQGNEGIGLIAKYYTVFNAKDITGIPELAKYENKEVVSDELISKMAEGMKVSIYNDGGDRAFYRPSTDTIHLPKYESFVSIYDYNATALHELSHATGAASRLARALGSGFGSPEYAYEELVAEISASFLSEHLEFEQTEAHFKNHKAYIQSWIQILNKNPEMLVKAIREADKAANYLEYQGGIISLDEYKQNREVSLDIEEEQHQRGNMVEELTIEKHIQACGYSATKEIVSMYEELTKELGTKLTLRDICNAYKAHTYADNQRVDSLISSLANQFQQQEMISLQMEVIAPEL